jgi:hypothetical protein
MKHLAVILLYFGPFACMAQEQEIQRALIQRDQQSAEFAAGVRGSSELARLQHFHALQLRHAGRPLHPDPEIARQLQPYERQTLANERELRLPPPVITRSGSDPELRPLPLPGGPRHGVDPIPAQGPGH